MSDLTPGIHTIPAADYHADPAPTPSLSSSLARILIGKSPAHAWHAHPRLNPNYTGSEPAAHFDVGTIAHSIILERDTSSVDVVDFDDWRTNAAKEARDASRAQGRQPILAKNWPTIDRMTNAVLDQLAQHTATPALFTDGTPERVIVWQENGVWLRARCDWIRDDHACIDDLKSTAKSADPMAVSRTILNLGYDVQAAMYLRGLKAITGKAATFRFVFVETEAPYGLSVIELSPAVLALADEKVDHAIRVWADCLRTGSWPAYTSKVATVELPAWAESQWFDRVDAEEANAA